MTWAPAGLWEKYNTRLAVPGVQPADVGAYRKWLQRLFAGENPQQDTWDLGAVGRLGAEGQTAREATTPWGRVIPRHSLCDAFGYLKIARG
jgi:hypothetical protein